jgi:hypothetical protein
MAVSVCIILRTLRTQVGLLRLVREFVLFLGFFSVCGRFLPISIALTACIPVVGDVSASLHAAKRLIDRQSIWVAIIELPVPDELNFCFILNFI